MPDPVNPRLDDEALITRILARNPGLTREEVVAALAAYGWDVDVPPRPPRAPRHQKKSPRVIECIALVLALLTPGPYNETYFEHAYLARYLGFPLVEGGDLTVRDRRVFIKTLEGLQPVARQSFAASRVPRCSKRPPHRRTVDGSGDRDASATSGTARSQLLLAWRSNSQACCRHWRL